MTTAPPFPNSTPSGPGAGPIAGLGIRTAAGVVDALIVSGAFVLTAVATGGSDTTGSSFSLRVDGLPAVLLSLLVLAYFFALELLAGGTVGKLIFGLRVVRDDGSAATAGPIALRTLLRLVDGICFNLVAFIAVAATQRNQRLGDMVAKTLVVRR